MSSRFYGSLLADGLVLHRKCVSDGDNGSSRVVLVPSEEVWICVSEGSPQLGLLEAAPQIASHLLRRVPADAHSNELLRGQRR